MESEAIIPRNVHFEFDPSLPAYWHSNNPVITSYFDALSFTFPEGERFFIDSVKYFAGRITDPQLKKDVAAFTAQEAIHSREHNVYNKNLAHTGINVEAIEGHVRWFVKQLRKLPPRAQLAITCALEHFTALFAEATLSDPRNFANAHPFYRDLWHWHAMEEEEHKAVAFDVFRAVTPGIRFYFYRCAAMAVMAVDFTFMSTVLPMVLLAQRGELFNFRAWAGSFYFHCCARHLAESALGRGEIFRAGISSRQAESLGRSARLARSLPPDRKARTRHAGLDLRRPSRRGLTGQGRYRPARRFSLTGPEAPPKHPLPACPDGGIGRRTRFRS